MQTYDKESHLIYLKARDLTEYAYEVHVLKCCTGDSFDVSFAQDKLKAAYSDLQRAMLDAGLI